MPSPPSSPAVLILADSDTACAVIGFGFVILTLWLAFQLFRLAIRTVYRPRKAGKKRGFEVVIRRDDAPH